MPLASDRVWHGGQIIAVVLAETCEAAYRLDLTYVAEEPSAGFHSAGTTTVAAKDVSSNYEDPEVGDAEAAFAGASVTIDQHYATPTQHHNPIELFTTSCAWADGNLTVWEGSQNVADGLSTISGDTIERRASISKQAARPDRRRQRRLTRIIDCSGA